MNNIYIFTSIIKRWYGLVITLENKILYDDGDGDEFKMSDNDN